VTNLRGEAGRASSGGRAYGHLYALATMLVWLVARGSPFRSHTIVVAPLAAARLSTPFVPHWPALRLPMKSPRYWQLSSPVPSDSCNFAPSGVRVTLVYGWAHAAMNTHATPTPAA
jgi:hypothetical protein